MSSSPDVVLNRMLENLRRMPDEFLDLWYDCETFYRVYSDGEVIGILDLNVKKDVVSNIGVARRHRARAMAGRSCSSRSELLWTRTVRGQS